MANAVIGFPRWTTKASWGADGTSYAAAYPVTNLGVLPLSQVARTTNATGSKSFTATLDKLRGVRLLALVGHNLSLDATITIQLYDAVLGGSPEPDPILELEDLPVWPAVYSTDDLEWEDDNWWAGTYTAEEIAGYTWTRPFWLDALYLARAIRVTISDAGNDDGYLQVGLFEIAQGWQVSVNPEMGAEYGFRFRTVTQEALGGVKTFDRRDKPRVFRGNIPYLPRDEAMSRGFEQLRQNDLDTPFLWLPNPEATLHLFRECYLATNVDPGLLAYATANNDTELDSLPLAFEEVI